MLYNRLWHFRKCSVYFVDFMFLLYWVGTIRYASCCLLQQGDNLESFFQLWIVCKKMNMVKKPSINLQKSGHVCVNPVNVACCFIFCLLCSSFTAACHNSFYFPFVVDKHDIEPSHRCMRTQKAQLSANPSAPRLSTSRSEGGGVDGA